MTNHKHITVHLTVQANDLLDPDDPTGITEKAFDELCDQLGIIGYSVDAVEAG